MSSRSRAVRSSQSSRDIAEERRRAHRRLPSLVDAKKAPMLSKEAKSDIVAWCGRQATNVGNTPWRVLGESLFQHGMNCDLDVYFRSSRCGHTAEEVCAWLQWQRLFGGFSEQDTMCALKKSRLRGLWLTLTRKRGSSVEEALLNGESAVDADSGEGAVSDSTGLVLVGGQGTRCEVGRLPMRSTTELPTAPSSFGNIANVVWVPRDQGRLAQEKFVFWDVFWKTGERHDEWILHRLHRPGDGGAGLATLVAQEKSGLILSFAQLCVLLGRCRRQETLLLPTCGTTLTASRSCRLVAAVPMQGGDIRFLVLSAQDWASIMGVGPAAQHPIRQGLRAVPEGYGRAMVGQAVHVAVVESLLKRVGVAAGLWAVGESPNQVIRYASLFSGMDLVAAALMEVCGEQWTFYLASEAVESVRAALIAAWGFKLRYCTANALHSSTRQLLEAAEPPIDVLFFSWRCAPWSSAWTLAVSSERRQRTLNLAVREIYASLGVVVAGRPRVIIMECVASITRKCFAPQWRQIQGLIKRYQDWKWSKQIICPRRDLGSFWPRKRLWIVGIRRQKDGAEGGWRSPA